MQQKKISQVEYIVLMAALMTVPALAIDAILPALDIIGDSIGTISNSENQSLIIMIFLGLGIGPLFFGPISDSYRGRKREIRILKRSKNLRSETSRYIYLYISIVVYI